MRELGGVDILVNNAATPGGVGPAGQIAQVTAEALLEDVNVKVAGYLRTARAAAPHMIAGGWGRIVNIGGLAARRNRQLRRLGAQRGRVRDHQEPRRRARGRWASMSPPSIRARPAPRRPTRRRRRGWPPA
ncbi:MAG: SDR family oxidoreductase [Caulobacteraceae bacterium]